MVKRHCEGQHWAGQPVVKVYPCKVFIFLELIFANSSRFKQISFTRRSGTCNKRSDLFSRAFKGFRGGCCHLYTESGIPS